MALTMRHISFLSMDLPGLVNSVDALFDESDYRLEAPLGDISDGLDAGVPRRFGRDLAVVMPVQSQRHQQGFQQLSFSSGHLVSVSNVKVARSSTTRLGISSSLTKRLTRLQMMLAAINGV